MAVLKMINATTSRKTEHFVRALTVLNTLNSCERLPYCNFTVTSQPGHCMTHSSPDGSEGDPHTALLVQCNEQRLEDDSLAK